MKYTLLAVYCLRSPQISVKDSSLANQQHPSLSTQQASWYSVSSPFPKPEELNQVASREDQQCRVVNAPGKNPQLMRDKCPTFLSQRNSFEEICARLSSSCLQEEAAQWCIPSGFSPCYLSHSSYSHLPNKLPAPMSLSQALLQGLRGAIWLEE